MAAAAVLVLGGGGIAYADDLQTDLSVDSLEISAPANLGVLACGSTKQIDVSMFIRRTSNAANNTFQSGSTATYSVAAESSVSATDPNPASITLPGGWDDLDPNSHASSPSSRSTITVAAGTANGSFDGSVTYQVSGTAENDDPLARTDTVDVTWKVENCVSGPPADTTAPVVVLTCPPAPVSRGAEASASWVASDEAGGSGLATASSGTIPLDTSALGIRTAIAPAGTAVDNANNPSAEATCSYTVVDTTPPVVVLTCPPEVARGSVAHATWEATDEDGGSGIAAPSSGSIQLDTSTLGDKIATAVAGTAHDRAGNASLETTCGYTVVDRTPPVVVLTCPTTVLLDSVAEATWTAADELGGSGLATAPSGSIALDTSSVGSKVAVAPAGTAVDKAGNESEAKSCEYSVIYDFDGFFRPVDMGGVVNSVKAGSAVPMKFSLGGDQGLDIIAAGYPKVTFTTCSTGATVDEIESTVTAGGSSLTYDPVAGQYVYVWKTDKSWAGKCGTFALKLDDGQTRTALFKFLK
ncbi:PxKF domain-containing protein [Agromyces mariniharenae]|uniref:HYR domain-containing protein n=1 Tax=Agromyces mariniharenae TaxID=2604423 RepID=A0A5S4V3A8_9MICO|nr:PxKF domain-containing protein [Agromyces mariniharenae]TYL53617.1 hypothetical protein FYC51_08155 [Agromyces mariniharenae]